jgi:hypothetical protein
MESVELVAAPALLLRADPAGTAKLKHEGLLTDGLPVDRTADITTR